MVVLMSGEQDPSGKGKHRAEDLGPSGFDPHAPYQPVELHPESYALRATTNQEKNLALLAHLIGWLSVFVGSVPGFLGPLIIWLTQKDVSPFVEEQAREALNFQITLLIIGFGCGILVFATCGMLFPLVLIPVLLQVIFGIVATLSVSNGRAYHYPFNIRLIK
jgi:uncharacterized protein